MEVSGNRGTPKSSTLIRFSPKKSNHFWIASIYGKPHMYRYTWTIMDHFPILWKTHPAERSPVVRCKVTSVALLPGSPWSGPRSPRFLGGVRGQMAMSQMSIGRWLVYGGFHGHGCFIINRWWLGFFNEFHSFSMGKNPVGWCFSWPILVKWMMTGAIPILGSHRIWYMVDEIMMKSYGKSLIIRGIQRNSRGIPYHEWLVKDIPRYPYMIYLKVFHC